MRKLILIILAWAALSPAAWADTKIGVVDMEKMMKTLPRAVKIRAEIETDYNKKKKELEKSEDDLRTLEKDLEKKKAVLSEEALKQKQQSLQKQILEFREQVTKSQMDLQKKQSDLFTPVLEQIKKAISEVATERGYALIFTQEQNLLYVGKSVDVTDDVLKYIESKKLM